MKIRILFTSVFNIGTKAIPVEKNQVMDVSFEDAMRLVEGGCAEVVIEDEVPAPKPKRKVTHGDG